MLKKIPLLALSFAVALTSACGGDSKHNPTGPGPIGGDNNGGNNGDNGNNNNGNGNNGNAGSFFEATVTGNGSETLHGSAEFGTATNDAGERAFVVALKAQQGAIVFVRRDQVATPQPGDYALADATGEVPGGEFYAAVFEGSLDNPTAALVSRNGTLRVTSASDRGLQGEFEFDAAGTLPGDPETVVEVNVSGTFGAAPASTADGRITGRITSLRALTRHVRP
jgi:hypothetical protein